jgi:hypothetical protein
VEPLQAHFNFPSQKVQVQSPLVQELALQVDWLQAAWLLEEQLPSKPS